MDWRGRGIVLVQFTLLACIVNALMMQLPGSTPLLVGNMAAVAVALRFGFLLSVPVALCATGITGEVYWPLLALLECLMVAHWRDRSWPPLGLWWRIWLPLSPVVAWITLPDGADDPLLWAIATAVVLATGATSIIGGRQLARVTRSRRQRATQSMATQLSVQLSTLMAAPATVAIALLVQWGHQHDVQRTALLLDGRAAQFASDATAQVTLHRDAVTQAALTLPALGAIPTLTGVSSTYPGFLSLLVTNAQGRVEAAVRRGEGEQPPGNDVSDRAYFRDTMALRRPTVSPVFRGRSIGSDVIVAVAAPRLVDGHGPMGVVQGSLALGQIAMPLRGQLDRDGLQYLVTDAGGSAAISSLPDLPALATPGEVEARLGGRSARQGWSTWLFQAPPLRFDRSEQHLVATEDAPSIGWTLRVLQPLRPLQARQTLRSLMAAAFVLGIILGLQQVASRFAERHTRGLAKVVERLRVLDPSHRGRELGGTLDVNSAELSALVADLEDTESRLQAMHDALMASAEDLRTLNRELEQRVDQRTAELSEALARAEHFAAAKSSFLANMSHELRTPLAAILGYSEQGMRDDAHPGEMRRCLQTVVRNGRHLLEIVNDVLDASKIEAGQLRAQSVPVSPLPLVGEAIELLRPRASEKGLQLLLSAHWPLPATVLADPLRLKQILLNLLSNAIKFTPSGFVAVRVTADANARRWSMDVEDTGIGMDEAQCERVFQRFEQADESTTRRFGGTGLGLYISRQLARQMGGDLTATSTPGIGSRFLVSLPIGLETPWVEDGEAMPSTEPPRTGVMPNLRGRVLVVDDVEDLRGLVRARVEATGADVVEAENGRDALEAIARETFDLVLMDMHMPVMDGREAVIRLRADGSTLPVYACSADVMEQDVSQFLALGCNGALGKPIDGTALNAVLSRHLVAAEATTAPTDALAAAMAAVRGRFIAQAPHERAALAEAARRADGEALRQLAHRLKGSAGTFGFEAVGHAAAGLEQALMRRDPDYSEALSALDRLLEGLN